MKHLDDTELVDALDRSVSERIARHLVVCGTCRAQLEDLRLAATHLAGEEPAQPPGAFWDHFADRVNRAIDTPAPERGWFTIGHLAWLGSLAIVALAMTASLLLRGPRGEIVETAGAVLTDVPADPADDEAWTLVGMLGAELDFDDVRDAGIAPAAGAIDRAAVELSDEELAALVKLIEEDMKRTDS